MSKIKFENNQVLGFVDKADIKSKMTLAAKAMESLKKGKCKGNDFLGWLNLPAEITAKEIKEIEACAKDLRKRTQVMVVIGIGGSYLGARAVIEALSGSFDYFDGANMKVIFAGHNIGEDYYKDLIKFLDNKEFGICVISKSGTTTEPAIAFRLMKALLEKKVGKEEAGKRIVAITDAKKGALRTLATNEGYKTFIIPDNVGGRFSVLTPVGLLPIAIAGFDIKKLLKGAVDMRNECLEDKNNIAIQYAATRQALYSKEYKVELLANFNPRLHYITEWWKQLYGESEGKENKGLFPAGADFTTDLHSMGQYIQQGLRMIAETVVSVASPNSVVKIPKDKDNLDKLNFLAGKRVDEVNKMAELGTQLAHVDGGVPNMKVVMDDLSEESIGQLFYFFELAVGVSGLLLDVNPFDQPGVEAYKNNMFALLDKPGYEEASKAIRKRIDSKK